MIKKKTKKNSGESNLFRVINVAATKLLFFAIANHMFTIVGDDASYLKSFTTSLIMLGPRQTMYILISGDRLPGRYYTAA
jgi:laccase